MSKADNIPWVEKYRPSSLDGVVLDEVNRTLLDNILKNNYFPNLLLYGPPGTGKTTTIINLVKQYQVTNNNTNQGLMIHLNASDDRGVDTIRNQICSFVSSKGLFSDGMKFIILDEVDYMTKNAQLALRCLLNSECSENVRYCLICNYSSRIDESLQNDLLRLRFNQLPPARIVAFLRNIVAAEGLSFTDEMLVAIQRGYQSDIRSMINLLQTRQSLAVSKFIPTDECYAQIAALFEDKSIPYEQVLESILGHCSRYRSNERAFLKEYLGYVVRRRSRDLTRESVSLMSRVVHDRDSRPSIVLRYFVSSWADVMRSEGVS
jgi:replication factor C subunit 3/5